MTDQNMTQQRLFRALALLVAATLFALLVACSSSNNNNNNKTITISLSTTPNPAPTTLAPGGTLQVTATVANDTANAGVTWSCTPASTCGSFSANSSASGTAVTYTAPSTPPSSAVIITATSVTDTSVTQSLPGITIATPTITVTLNNVPTTMTPSQTAMISATTNDTAGVNWSCTPANACGSFSPTSSLTGASVTYTAPASAGSVTITATSVTDTSVSANATVTVSSSTVTGLAAGNYVFSLAGTDYNTTQGATSSYFYAGVFTVNSAGAISGGEQDFSDDVDFAAQESITGGTIAASAAGNLTITLQFTDTYIGNGAGQVTFDASPVSASKFLLIEYDTFASGSGELDAQATSSLAVPSGGYAFYTAGLDLYGVPSALGGVINVDGNGTISGSGSVMDINDPCVTNNPCAPGVFPAQILTAGTVTAPDALGHVTFSLNSACDPTADPNLCTPGFNASVLLNGYIVDADHIRLIEAWQNDSLGDVTGGTALGQGTNTGNFSTASASGSTYVIGTNGYDTTGALQVAGLLTFNSGGTMGGTLSYNDIGFQNAQGGEAISGGSYTVDPTGRVTVTGVTDTAAHFTYNYQLYLTGDGHAVAISMDSTAVNPDVLAGLGWQQTSSTLNAASLSGSYALGFTQVVDGDEEDAVGAFSSDGVSSISGFLDINGPVSSTAWTPSANNTVSSTYATTSTNGIFNVTGTGNSQTPYTAYLIDGTQGVVIENDSSQLSLGYFDQQ